jgi:hypothetical protein
MINFLEGEEPLADLRHGAIQRITDDIFSLKTIILTNKRLIMIVQRLGSFNKKFIFLKDVTSLESVRVLNIPLLIATICMGLIGLIIMNSALGAQVAVAHRVRGEGINPGTILGLIMLVCAGLTALAIKKNALRISTQSENIDFMLEKNFSTDLVDNFIDRTQVEIDKLKHR